MQDSTYSSYRLAC